MIMNELLEIIPKHESYGDDKVIILEGANSLHSESAIMNFRNFLVDNKIKHNVVYNLDMMDNKMLIETIKSGLDAVISFETTGISESFSKAKQIIVHLSNQGYRFRIIECGYKGYFNVNRIPLEAKKENVSLYHLESKNDEISKWKLEKRS